MSFIHDIDLDEYDFEMSVSKCCKFIPIHTGVMILAVISLILSIGIWVISIPFLANVDENVFNPLEKYHNETFGLLEEWLEEYFNFTDVNIDHHVEKR